MEKMTMGPKIEKKIEKDSVEWKSHVSNAAKDISSYLSSFRWKIEMEKNDNNLKDYFKNADIHSIEDYLSRSSKFKDVKIEDIDGQLVDFSSKYENLISRIKSEDFTREEILFLLEDMHNYLMQDKFRYVEEAA